MLTLTTLARSVPGLMLLLLLLLAGQIVSAQSVEPVVETASLRLWPEYR